MEKSFVCLIFSFSGQVQGLVLHAGVAGYAGEDAGFFFLNHLALVQMNYALVTIVRTVPESIIDLQTIEKL